MTIRRRISEIFAWLSLRVDPTPEPAEMVRLQDVAGIVADFTLTSVLILRQYQLSDALAYTEQREAEARDAGLAFQACAWPLIRGVIHAASETTDTDTAKGRLH